MLQYQKCNSNTSRYLLGVEGSEKQMSRPFIGSQSDVFFSKTTDMQADSSPSLPPLQCCTHVALIQMTCPLKPQLQPGLEPLDDDALNCLNGDRPLSSGALLPADHSCEFAMVVLCLLLFWRQALKVIGQLLARPASLRCRAKSCRWHKTWGKSSTQIRPRSRLQNTMCCRRRDSIHIVGEKQLSCRTRSEPGVARCSTCPLRPGSVIKMKVSSSCLCEDSCQDPSTP